MLLAFTTDKGLPVFKGNVGEAGKRWPPAIRSEILFFVSIP